MDVKNITIITHLELAEQLDKNQYRDEITDNQEQLAKDNNLVVMFGQSDDIVMIQGSIDEETYPEDGSIYFWKRKLFTAKEPFESDQLWEQKEYFEGYGLNVDLTEVEAIFGPEDSEASWVFKMQSGIPYTEFRIMEDDDLFCIGIVFDLSDLAD